MLSGKYDFTPAIIDFVDALIVVLDLEGRITYFNQTYEKVAGYSLDEVRNGYVWDFFLIPEEIEPVKAVFQQLRTGDFPNKHVNYFVSKDGSRRLIDWSNTVLLDDKGNAEYIVGTGIDITERVQAEKALKESEQRYRTLFEDSVDGIYISTPEGRYIYANPALVRMLGYESQEDLLSINITKDLYFAESERPLPAQRHKPITTRLRKKDGNEIWVEIHSRVIFDDGGKALFYQGITRDITERREAEKLLQESEARYHTLFEDSPISLWEEDLSEIKRYIDYLKGYGVVNFHEYFENNQEELKKLVNKIKIIDVNRKTLSLYNAKSKDEFLSRISEIYPDESINEIEEGIVAIAEGKNNVELEVINRTFDGRILCIAATHSVIPGYEDALSKVLVSRVDITERKELEKNLRFMATHDSLTGLYSRAFFEEELSRYSDKRFLPLGIIMFDVDGLKFVNDTFGHAKGDELLITTARILSSILRASEILARIGGDEFAAILPNVNERVIRSIIERLELQLSEENRLNDDADKIKISYGYSIRQNENIDIARVLRKVDKNLYDNKMAKK
jgi:diguanylate cyclase (GGDEF)-like protein/PAS domain S-box-containing protein